MTARYLSIFCLRGFEEELIKDTLTSMIQKKRATAVEALKGRASAQRISRVITIERQEKNKGSAGVGQSVASLKSDRTPTTQPHQWVGCRRG